MPDPDIERYRSIVFRPFDVSSARKALLAILDAMDDIEVEIRRRNPDEPDTSICAEGNDYNLLFDAVLGAIDAALIKTQ